MSVLDLAEAILKQYPDLPYSIEDGSITVTPLTSDGFSVSLSLDEPGGEFCVLIERWRHHYNTVRPHSALGYRPPAPQTIVPIRTDPAFAMDGLQPDQPYPETAPGLT